MKDGKLIHKVILRSYNRYTEGEIVMKKIFKALFQVIWGYSVMFAITSIALEIFTIDLPLFFRFLLTMLIFRVSFSDTSDYAFAFRVELRCQHQSLLDQD